LTTTVGGSDRTDVVAPVLDAPAILEWQRVSFNSFDEEFAHTARIVGIRDFETPSLEAVERRRSELWVIAFLAVCVLAIGLVLVTVAGDVDGKAQQMVRQPAFRLALLAATLGFTGYVLEKERHLRRLTRLLLDERVLTAALSNRLKELATLCQVGKAVNSVLAIEDVMQIILSSALELLEGRSGSIMLRDDDKLEVLCEQGNHAALGARVRIGEGVAGQVAARREPVLVSGRMVDDDGRSRANPVQSAVCVPLLNRDELLGVLNVNGTPERPFTEYDLRALTLFAEHAAMAIANSRLYEAERDHVAQLMELDRLKSDFVATVSHELRTPLTSILGCARTLQRKDVPAEVSGEFLQMIERQGTRLLHLVEDIMDMQRTTVTESVACRPVDISNLLDEVVRVQSLAGRKVSLYAASPLVAMGEPDGLQRVFTNLIDNGFSHGGGEVEIEAVPTMLEGRPAVEIAVLDRGPGVLTADRESVFERFKRGRDAFSPGMGLGLYLVRSLVEVVGGSVAVDDRPGGGAAFRVVLLAAEATT
jgi:two-component system sensor histidine kinase KdpD